MNKVLIILNFTRVFQESILGAKEEGNKKALKIELTPPLVIIIFIINLGYSVPCSYCLLVRAFISFLRFSFGMKIVQLKHTCLAGSVTGLIRFSSNLEKPSLLNVTSSSVLKLYIYFHFKSFLLQVCSVLPDHDIIYFIIKNICFYINSTMFHL